MKRNKDRFPEYFMIQLDSDEKSQVVAFCDHLSKLKFSKALPYAFTEHGAIMAASVLNTSRTIEVGVFIVRAFIKLRQLIADNKELSGRLAHLERHLADHDEQISEMVKTIRQLMKPDPLPKRRRIGFHSD